MVEVQRNGVIQHVLIHPNQSLTPVQFWLAFAALAFITLMLAVLLAFLGFWLVVPVALLHLGIVWSGFYLAWKRSERIEFVRFEEGRVIVGNSQAGPQAEFNRHWLRVVERSGTTMESVRVFLGSHGRQLEIGRDINAEERRGLKQILQTFLHAETASEAEVPAADSTTITNTIRQG